MTASVTVHGGDDVLAVCDDDDEPQRTQDDQEDGRHDCQRGCPVQAVTTTTEGSHVCAIHDHA